MEGERAATRLLLVTRECNNHCIFCGQVGLPRPDDADGDVEERLLAARSESDALTLVGGEPTLDRRLPERVSRAKALGFETIIVQTNGAMLDEPLAQDLARRGLTGVHLSLHGAEARVHDYHTGIAGSFERLLAAARASRASQLVVSVTTVVTKSNFRVLSPIPALVSSLGASSWMLAFPRAAGRAAEAADRVLPRYGLAVPYALHAIEAATRLGLPAVISGVPSCLLGPFAKRALGETPRSFGDVCVGCAAREACVGVDASYLARFGGDELAKAPMTPRDPETLELETLFAGPGELAVPVVVDAAILPATRVGSHRALPLLGKVKPALAEAPSTVTRRSGEALREIFPALFEREPDDPDAPAK
jgi:hypothetical protein